ncbi:MAG: glycoside hydrolase family 31 protein [Oculatellaceae cyanobacterium bins.114]|nr:glycoside hydrolase family 31 protein [Oculatellaceae cyanobacterium bins.114]
MPQFFGSLHSLESPWHEIPAVTAVEPHDRGVELVCGEARLRVSILAANLIRVRFVPNGDFLPRRSWAVTRDDAEWETPAFEIEEGEGAVRSSSPLGVIALQTDKIRVLIHRNPCRIACYDTQMQPFASDAELGLGWRSGSVASWKRIEDDEHFYGFGERTGLLDKRSERKTNWTVDALDYGSLTDEMYQAIPFFLALRPGLSYGLFLNSTHWSQFDMGARQSGIWQMETQSSELDYYIIYGPEPAQILDTYTQLTGRMPLPPKWSLGYHQCRWSYESEDVVRELAREFRDRHIPCDVIHLDIDYMRGYRVFTWSPKRFPNPAKLIGDLAANGFKTVSIVDPGVKYEPEADYPIFDQGFERDYFVRKADGTLVHGYVWPEKAVFPDFLKPEVREWWGNWQKSLTEAGVAGIWNDMNEPALDDRPFGDEGNKIAFPLDAPQGAEGERTTHAEAHNLYGLGMAQACAEGLERLRNERPFVLTRSGFAGIQRWSSVWMGDNHSLWDHLEMSLPMLCNMGLSGVAFVGCDIGGFASNATAELFARWMQVGMLYPLMRGHSAMSTARHEPWVFGDRVETICRDYIELRYRLMPYLYTLFWQASNTGAPILRPLVYEFPNDPKTYTLHDQVMLGPFLMAAPVYRPGVECRAVYLPDGIWYDWWTGERYDGGNYIMAHAPLERMPMYVRAGAIIPMRTVTQYVDERPLTELTLWVYPGDGEWLLYEDDGRSFDYRSGAYSTTQYRVIQAEQQLHVDIEPRQGSWTPPDREVIVVMVGVGEQRFQDDGSTHRLTFATEA